MFGVSGAFVSLFALRADISLFHKAMYSVTGARHFGLNQVIEGIKAKGRIFGMKANKFTQNGLILQ